MSLIDAFMFFDEDLMLDIRLNTLNSVVDKFIIAEGTRDHAGNEKKLNFDINKYKKFKNKIKYLVVEDIPKEISFFKKGWEPSHIRDQFQRNALSRSFVDLQDNDLIMISDIDEIPRPEKISDFLVKIRDSDFFQSLIESGDLDEIKSSDFIKEVSSTFEFLELFKVVNR